MIRGTRRRRPARLVVTAAVGAIGLAYAYPYLWMLATSVKSRSDAFDDPLGLIPKSATLANYADAWDAARLAQNFANTLIVATVATFITILVTSMAGYTLARMRFPARRVVVATLLVSLFAPRGYSIIPIVSLVRSLGLGDSLAGIILVSVGTSIAFNTLLFWAYFRTVTPDYEEAAVLDGASPPAIYFRVMFPLAFPIAAGAAILEYVANWNDFFMPLVLTFGQADLQTIPVGIYLLLGQHGSNWPLLAAATAIAMAPVVILFVILQRRVTDAFAESLRW